MFGLWIFAAIAAFFHCVQAQASNGTSFGTIGIKTFGPNNSVLRTSIDNGPINLADQGFIEDFIELLESLNSTVDSNGDPPVKVVIVASALETYFIDTFDIRLFLPPGPINNNVNGTAVLFRFWHLQSLLSTLPQLFIAEIDGVAYAAGNELIFNMDLRYAGPGAIFGAPEAVCGVLHVGGIEQLTSVIGPAYANEYMISALPIEGPRAAEIGWVNKYYESSEELSKEVDALASRIALFPYTAITANKKAIRRLGPTQEQIDAGKTEFFALVQNEFVQTCVLNWLELAGGNESYVSDSEFQRTLLDKLPNVWT
ncbi:unnamed protein product [Periconia digitata]|uniref:Enoyl-CoA hydratase n=1 Tax=Periconia digitata TaxID=1303443 RepID=A0A9W4XTY1_9PLEO|nr:unnamed protein product [Periconia digitata]